MWVFTDSTFQYLFCSISGLISHSAVCNPKAFPQCMKQLEEYLSVTLAMSIFLQRKKCSAVQHVILIIPHTQHTHAAGGICCTWQCQGLGRAQGMGVGVPCPCTGRKRPSVGISTLASVPHTHINPNFTESEILATSWQQHFCKQNCMLDGSEPALWSSVNNSSKVVHQLQLKSA